MLCVASRGGISDFLEFSSRCRFLRIGVSELKALIAGSFEHRQINLRLSNMIVPNITVI